MLSKWFGKDEVVSAIKGVGNFIDEQQLTPEEAMKYRLHLLDKLDGFKVVQRIIVSIVFSIWAFLIVFGVFGVIVEALFFSSVMKDGMLEIMAMEFVYIPTSAAAALYLGGGVKLFKK